MSSAICFNLDQSKILSSGNGLRIENIFWKRSNSIFSCVKNVFLLETVWEVEKMLVTSIFSFIQQSNNFFFPFWKQKSIFLVILILFYANALRFENSRFYFFFSVW